MSESSDFGDKTPRGIDRNRLRYAWSLDPWERVEHNRRAAENVILLREAGRRLRAEGSLGRGYIGKVSPEDPMTLGPLGTL